MPDGPLQGLSPGKSQNLGDVFETLDDPVLRDEMKIVENKPALEGIEINQAFIGTCASGRMEDLRLAAGVLKGKRVHPNVRLLITPITPMIAEQAAREGLIETFLQAGAVIGPPTCGPCFGGFGYLLPGEVAITTGTLNVPGRMGSIDAKIYMGNPATVAASAVEGKISDPRRILNKR